LVRKVTTARPGFPRQPDVGIAVLPLISRIKEQMRFGWLAALALCQSKAADLQGRILAGRSGV
jgi:hypothetical protein